MRDRALLLVGFMGAFRRSELSALDVDDLEDRPEGMAILLRRSKVDQEARGPGGRSWYTAPCPPPAR